jgi:plasmid maintenance system antidote protein VapI
LRFSADSALRVARCFGTAVEFWTGLQAHYDTERAEMELGDRLEKEVKRREPAARHPER